LCAKQFPYDFLLTFTFSWLPKIEEFKNPIYQVGRSPNLNRLKYSKQKLICILGMSSLLSKALVTPQKHLPVTPPQRPPSLFQLSGTCCACFCQKFHASFSAFGGGHIQIDCFTTSDYIANPSPFYYINSGKALSFFFQNYTHNKPNFEWNLLVW